MMMLSASAPANDIPPPPPYSDLDTEEDNRLDKKRPAVTSPGDSKEERTSRLLSSLVTPLHASPPTDKDDDLKNETTQKELLQLADECTVVAYDLVWEDKDYETALLVLKKALEIQRACLGKHHVDVGCTCHFVATAYWLQQRDFNAALRYFLEAKRIFCKNQEDDTTTPLLSSIEQRIVSILKDGFGLPAEDIDRAQKAIHRTLEHELQGDKFKAQGMISMAREEYKRARQVARVLRQLL